MGENYDSLKSVKQTGERTYGKVKQKAPGGQKGPRRDGRLRKILARASLAGITSYLRHFYCGLRELCRCREQTNTKSPNSDLQTGLDLKSRFSTYFTWLHVEKKWHTIV